MEFAVQASELLDIEVAGEALGDGCDPSARRIVGPAGRDLEDRDLEDSARLEQFGDECLAVRTAVDDDLGKVLGNV